MTDVITCEFCKQPMNGIITHDTKCRKYYEHKNREVFERGHR